jgi:DNA-nicking Smr family endonuclease
MAAKGPRHRLGPEERRLWERVAASTRPLRSETSEAVSPVPRDPRKVSGLAGDTVSIESASARRGANRSPLGAAPDRLIPSSFADAAPVGWRQAGLDRRTAERLRKGARAPDGRIDLHGMTADRAHRASLRFLADSLSRGHRVVLVITGKGRTDDPGGPGVAQGVLRSSLPAWLRASPLGHSIVGIYQAHRRHGGEGAFYVYLKRHR